MQGLRRLQNRSSQTQIDLNFHIVIQKKNHFGFLLKNNPDFNWPKNGEKDMLSFAIITQNNLDILPECMVRPC